MVQQVIADHGIPIELVSETDIRIALRRLYQLQGLLVEPSSAVAVAGVRALAGSLKDPVCLVLTGANISPQDHTELMRGIA